MSWLKDAVQELTEAQVKKPDVEKIGIVYLRKDGRIDTATVETKRKATYKDLAEHYQAGLSEMCLQNVDGAADLIARGLEIRAEIDRIGKDGDNGRN